MAVVKPSSTLILVTLLAVSSLLYVFIKFSSMSKSKEAMTSKIAGQSNRLVLNGTNYMQPVFNDSGEWSGYFINNP